MHLELDKERFTTPFSNSLDRAINDIRDNANLHAAKGAMIYNSISDSKQSSESSEKIAQSVLRKLESVEPDFSKEETSFLKTQALSELAEIQKDKVVDNKLARALKVLEGFDVAQELNPAQSKLIWKNSLTTVDRKILTEFYNAHNSGNKIALDPACFDSKNTNALKDNQDDLQKIIQWNIKQANLEERKATTARRIEAAEADNKTFHGSAQGVEGDIAKGVKELQRNIEQPSDKVKNPIAERLKQRFRNKGEDMMA